MGRLVKLMNAYVFSLPQQRFVLSQTREVALALALPVVASECAQALAHNKMALDLERQYDIDRAVQADGQVAQILDRQIDAFVSAMHGVMSSWAGLGQIHPFGLQAGEMLSTCFPRGLKAHVQAVFTDQATYNEDLISTLRNPRNAAFVAAMGIGPQISEMEALNLKFCAQVRYASTVSYETLTAARDACEEEMLAVIMHIVTDRALSAKTIDDLLVGYEGTVATIAQDNKRGPNSPAVTPDPQTGDTPEPGGNTDKPVVKPEPAPTPSGTDNVPADHTVQPTT